MLTPNSKSNTDTSHEHGNWDDVVAPATASVTSVSRSPPQLPDLPPLPRLTSSDAAPTVVSAADPVECGSNCSKDIDALDLPPLPVSDYDYDDNTEFTDDEYECQGDGVSGDDDDDSNDNDIDENSVGEGEDDTDENTDDTESNDAVDQNSVAGAANMDDD